MNGPPAPPSPRAAGIVTRVGAAVVDLVVVLLMTAAVLVGVALARFVWSPLLVQWSAPPWPLALAVGGLIALAYLTIAWATTGRTCGGAVLGLRVLSAGHARLGWVRAALRAALCLLFPPGLLGAAISRRRRSLQDALLLSVVVYDWSDDAGLAATAATAAPQRPALGVVPPLDVSRPVVPPARSDPRVTGSAEGLPPAADGALPVAWRPAGPGPA